MSDRHESWWESVPCHFIWNLEKDVDVDFEGIASNLDSKLETREDVRWTDSACDMLLFRGYIEVSNFSGVKHNPGRAKEFFLEAEKEAMKVNDDLERKAYIIVSTASKLWILKKFGKTLEATPNEYETLLELLKQYWKECDHPESSEKLHSYIDTIAAFALSRLGPKKCKEAERRYKKAINILGNSAKSSWYQSLGTMIGRQARIGAGIHDKYDRIDDEIGFYKKALEIDLGNDSARCDLAMALMRFPEERANARMIMQEVGETSCEMIIKKARFHRRLKEHQEALRILEKGVKLQRPKADLFYQCALIYKDLAASASKERNWGNVQQYQELQSSYLDKCLDVDTRHFSALLDKAYLCSLLRQYINADELYRRIIDEFKSIPSNLLQAQFRYAGFLMSRNGNELNEAAACVSESVVDTAIGILRMVDNPEGNQETNRLLQKSKESLMKYYKENGHETKIQILRNKLSEIGY